MSLRASSHQQPLHQHHYQHQQQAQQQAQHHQLQAQQARQLSPSSSKARAQRRELEEMKIEVASLRTALSSTRAREQSSVEENEELYNRLRAIKFKYQQREERESDT